MKRVYIIVVNWNNAADTLICLDSLLIMNYDNYRVVVCDNGSTDESLRTIVDWLKGRNSSFVLIDESDVSRVGSLTDKIVVVKIAQNRGFAAGNNVGLRLVQQQNDYDYIWLLNNDTKVDAGALINLIDRARLSPQVGIWGSTLLHMDEPTRVQCIGGIIQRVLGVTRRTAGVKHVDDLIKLNEEEVAARIDYITAAAMLITRECFESTGYLDEDFFLYYEEPDYCWRAKKSFNLGWCKNSVVYHKVGGTVSKVDDIRQNKPLISDFYEVQSRIIFARKHLKIFLPIVYLGFCVTIFNRIRRKQASRVGMILKIIFISLFGKFPSYFKIHEE